MSDPGMAAIWCAVQVGVLSLFGAGAAMMLRRVHPRDGLRVANGTTLLSLVATSLMLLPFANWRERSLVDENRDTSAQADLTLPGSDPASTQSEQPVRLGLSWTVDLIAAPADQVSQIVTSTRRSKRWM